MTATATTTRNGTPQKPATSASRVPPQDLHAETCLLGSILLKPDLIDLLPGEMSPTDCYGPDHVDAIKAALEVRAQGRMPDATELYAKLQPAMGARAEELLHEAMGAVPHGAGWRGYAQIIRRMAMRRAVIAAGQDLMRGAWDEHTALDDVIAGGETALRKVLEERVGVSATPAKELALDLLTQINSPVVRGIPTGFRDLDALLSGGGLKGGELIVLAARPSVGKSALATNIATNVARDGTPVLVVSLEMSKSELMLRVVCRYARMTTDELLSGKLEEYHVASIVESVNLVGGWPLWVDDAAGRTISQIVSLCRLHRSRDKIGLIVVDYLQLISPDDRRQPREVQVSTISRELKLMARSLNVPVLALAQLNRAIEARENRRPKMSDLRESGAIEQDADTILFLDRPHLYDREAPENKAQLFVSKQRAGKTGDVDLSWDGRTMTFSDHVADYEYRP